MPKSIFHKLSEAEDSTVILSVTPNPCVDKTVFVERLTPGAKIRSQRYTCIPGGKGNNVARSVKALGFEAASLVIVGGPTGQHVVDMIEHQDGVRCIPVWVKDMTRTITTVLEESGHRQTAFFEPGPAVSKRELKRLVDIFSRALVEARVITLNGTVPDPRIDSLYQQLIRIAREAGVITILDTYGPELALALGAAPYMVKPNLTEAEGFVGFRLDTRDARQRAIDRLHEKGVELVVLSLGKEGALVSRGGERYHVIPPQIEEVNDVGSGDALVAGFAIGLQEGWPLEETARLAVAAGTANAMSWDIGHFTREEVNQVMTQVRIEPSP
jgi:1-phosphofructokinase family hexose kinase